MFRMPGRESSGDLFSRSGSLRSGSKSKGSSNISIPNFPVLPTKGSHNISEWGGGTLKPKISTTNIGAKFFDNKEPTPKNMLGKTPANVRFQLSD